MLLLAILVAAALLYQWWKGMYTWPVAVGTVIVLTWVMSAHDKVEQYQAWRRTWETVAGSRSANRGRGKTWLGAIVLGVVVPSLVIARMDRPAAWILWAIALGFALVLGAVLLAAKRARRASQETKPDDVVMLCAETPLLPVPALAQAYRNLPAHCWQVLRRE